MLDAPLEQWGTCVIMVTPAFLFSTGPPMYKHTYIDNYKQTYVHIKIVRVVISLTSLLHA